jgi:hypothetical protein
MWRDCLHRNLPPFCLSHRKHAIIDGESHEEYVWQALCGGLRSVIIIQGVPNLSRSIANRKAKNVSCIGMRISPPSESRSKMRSASSMLYREREGNAARRLKTL